MTPVGANGESAPACAPFPTMMIIRNAGIAARPATAIAIGPSRAAVDTLPGPTDANAHPSAKNMIGISPALPRHTRTARCAMRSSVRFCCACANNRVTPDSVRKSDTGKPPMTSFSGMPPTYTPTTHARASARMPTFSS